MRLLLLFISSILSAATAGAPPAAVAGTCTVRVLYPANGPAAALSFEGRRIGSITTGSLVEFQLPAGTSGRLRAGNGGVTRGTWPVFYSQLNARAGETIQLAVEVKLANTYGSQTIYTGMGAVILPASSQQVTEGSFRRLKEAEALALSKGLKVFRKGLVKGVAPSASAPTPTRQ